MLNEDFFGWKVYGPYVNSEPRRVVVLYKSTDDRSSMSYARYLMCIEENRLLEDYEEVDHIDGNPMNDSIDNLQVLRWSDHREKTDSAKSRTMITLTCPWCNTEFTRERRQVSYKKRKYPPCCSRSCAGKYQADQETLMPSQRKASKEIKHGTRAGYLKEGRLGIDRCDACRAANTAYTIELRNR